MYEWFMGGVGFAVMVIAFGIIRGFVWWACITLLGIRPKIMNKSLMESTANVAGQEAVRRWLEVHKGDIDAGVFDEDDIAQMKEEYGNGMREFALWVIGEYTTRYKIFGH